MKIDRVIPIIIITVLLTLAIFSDYKTDDKLSKCHSLGGVYINGQCFKAERINL